VTGDLLQYSLPFDACMYNPPARARCSARFVPNPWRIWVS